MRAVLTTAACLALAATSGIPLRAQLRNNTEKTLTCQNGYDSDRVRHCEIREQSLASIGRLSVDSSPNGGTTVKGWLRSDVLVRARIEAAADNQNDAQFLARQVSIDGSGGQVRAMGPQSANNSWWSVSYEIFVPQVTDLTVKTNNGGITISDVRGQIRFDATNGGVHLKRLAGDVSGATVNGGIQAELTGVMWDGRQLELTTHNGGVNLVMPQSYAAHLQAETGMGNIHSDFPIGMDPNTRSHKVDSNIGAGGPLIHITTGNGGVNIKRAESQ